jgi:preprotein translocase subunit SecY
MFSWITSSRFRTALAMLFFIFLFLISISFAFVLDSRIAAITNTIGSVAALIGVLGTISTVILAWRADRRATKESDLKVVQMQQQIKELEIKLNAASSMPQTKASGFE